MRTRSIRLAASALLLGLLLAACSEKDDEGSDATGTDVTTTTASDGAGASIAGMLDGKTLKICSDIPYAPMEMEDASKPSGYGGFDIDLVQAIVDEAGGELEVSVVGFSAIFAALDAKTCDAVVSSVSINPERQQSMAFTQPYLDSGQSLLVRKEDADTYKTLDDLAGKKIGVQEGTTGADYAKENTPEGATIQEAPGAADLFALLNAKSVDAVLQDYPINAYQATKDSGTVLQEQFPTKEQYGMAVRKDDPTTLRLLDEGITLMRENGTYDALYAEYLGKKIEG